MTVGAEEHWEGKLGRERVREWCMLNSSCSCGCCGGIWMRGTSLNESAKVRLFVACICTILSEVGCVVVERSSVITFGDSGSDQSKAKHSKLGNVCTSFSIPFLETCSFRSRPPGTSETISLESTKWQWQWWMPDLPGYGANWFGFDILRDNFLISEKTVQILKTVVSPNLYPLTTSSASCGRVLKQTDYKQTK